MSLFRDLVGHIAVVTECFGLVFNTLTLYLIARQGFESFDMWLALIISLCDIFLISLKLAQWIFLMTTKRFDIFDNIVFGQLDGFATSFFTSASILCIGFLALLRWWAIVKSRPVVFKHWALSFVIAQSILSLALVAIACKKEFILMPFGRYFFPDLKPGHTASSVAVGLLSLWCLFSVVVVNTCYPFIAWSCLDLNENHPRLFGCSTNDIAKERRKQKLIVIGKMFFLLFVYNLTMLPPFVITMLECIQQKIRTQTGDSLFALSFLILTLVNPLTLILLHEDTSRDLRNLSYSLFYSKSRTKLDSLLNQSGQSL